MAHAVVSGTTIKAKTHHFQCTLRVPHGGFIFSKHGSLVYVKSAIMFFCKCI